MATHEAQSYKDQGTPEEQSRRTFLANATLGVGGIIGLVLAVPLASSLVPEVMLKKDSASGTWTDISADGLKQIDAATTTPVKVAISFDYTDGYLPPKADPQSVWGVKLSPQMMADFQKSRPDLFVGTGTVPYKAFEQSLGFALFSPICPHLGCAFNWVPGTSQFLCPCHGSQFSLIGEHIGGPAPRGLDPLPVRDMNGKAQVTWIRYKSGQPDRVVISYN